MKKLKSLGRSLGKAEQRNINGGVYGGGGGGGGCRIWNWSGSNGSGDSMTCDYMLYDFAGNFIEYRCEIACRYGCNYSGCSFTEC